MISLIEPVIIEGKKMGKSKGGVISLVDIQKMYSADLFRFYITHGADFSVYMDFREKEIQAVKTHIHKFYNFMNDAILRSKNVEMTLDKVKNKYPKVVLSKVIKKFIESDEALEQFNLRRYLQISFYEVFNLIQDLFKFTDDNNYFLLVFKIVLSDWLRLLSLTLPHICEELWEISGKKTFISTEIWSNYKNEYINDEHEIEFKYISSVIEDILNIKKIVKNYKDTKIYVYVAPKWMITVLKLINLKGDNFDEILTELKKDKDLMKIKQLIPFTRSQLKSRAWEKKLPKIDETKLLMHYQTYIEKKVNSSIIINSEFDPKMRSKNAKPFKPGLYIDI
jgi:leucyl-tRNA synthetase